VLSTNVFSSSSSVLPVFLCLLQCRSTDGNKKYKKKHSAANYLLQVVSFSKNLGLYRVAVFLPSICFSHAQRRSRICLRESFWVYWSIVLNIMMSWSLNARLWLTSHHRPIEADLS
jgi:hypothetical protein